MASPTHDEVRIQADLAIACYKEGRDIFNAFITWLELRCFNLQLQQMSGKRHPSGQFPYLDALTWLIGRGERKTRVEKYIRAGQGIFFQIEWRQRPKAPLLHLISFEKVCQYFHVIPIVHWRPVPLAVFTPMAKRRSIVRAVMGLPAEDASPWERKKPITRGAIRARTGVSERTQRYDAAVLGIKRKKNWQPNNGDDFQRYPLYEIGSSNRVYGFGGPVGRIRRVQVAVFGTSCLKGGLGRFLRQRWPRRYFKTPKSLLDALRHQESHEGRGLPSGLTPREVDEGALYSVPYGDRLRQNAREWRRLENLSV